ncbi:hypothetical protein AB0G02_28460 [Actinosynnema sp. NPDC023658]|uniref:hypothetical protein n=1 Tax=Actinosynnema sp. NPDC023658 TaxID=3155465 RepID=UPI0033DCF6D2
MINAARELAVLLASVDERVRRFCAGNREAVLEDAAAVEIESLTRLAMGVDHHGLLEIERVRIRFFECRALARLFDEYVSTHYATSVRSGRVAHGAFAGPRRRVETGWEPDRDDVACLITSHPALGPASAVDPAAVDVRTAFGAPSPGHSASGGRVRGTARRPESASPLRMGFATDVVGYGRRSGRLRTLAQHRVFKLTVAVLEHLGVDLHDTDHQGTGDGLLVFLPAGLDVPRTVPNLLQGWRDVLQEDNELYADRLRLRMAVVIGPVAPGPLGFVGPPATTAGRLLDSEVLRAAVADNPGRDLVVLVSEALHSFAVEPTDPAFTRHPITVKDYRADGWLWVG